MPTYEYECEACGERHDVFQRMSDDPLVDCPGCGQAKLKKLLSAPAFQLKGTGWYQTDFKNSGKKPAKGDTPAADTSDTAADAGKDKSPDTDKKDTVTTEAKNANA